MEAYLHGVSARRVDDLVKALGAETGISKSEVWRICADWTAKWSPSATGRYLTSPSPRASTLRMNWTRQRCQEVPRKTARNAANQAGVGVGQFRLDRGSGTDFLR